MFISPFTDFSRLSSVDELIAAAEALFDPHLNLSADVIWAQSKALQATAKRVGCAGTIASKILELSGQHPQQHALQTDLSEADQIALATCRAKCSFDARGNLLCSTGNFLTIMLNDPLFKTLRRNDLTLRAEFSDESGRIYLWDDAHDAEGRGRIEDLYGIYSHAKYADAFERFLLRSHYHPLKDLIESIEWDGVNRISDTLARWMKADDTEYTREVSRLIFAGGIHRLYNPGCKFDEMPVLIGDQGAGKSTFVRWLAVEDRFFKELTSTKDKEGGELVEGSWIMEVAELLALTRASAQEEVKAFLSRQRDVFRAAYGKFVGDRPRTCIFIGTSNRDQFIADKTGGRRFYPVQCRGSAYELFDHEEECREYIRQCWAEALAKRDTDFMNPYPRREILSEIRLRQKAAAEDDYREDAIETYLEAHKHDAVCTMTLWRDALGILNREPTRSDQMQLSLIMKKFPRWARVNRWKPTQYGQKRYWVFVDPSNEPTFQTSNDDIPF